MFTSLNGGPGGGHVLAVKRTVYICLSTDDVHPLYSPLNDSMRDQYTLADHNGRCACTTSRHKGGCLERYTTRLAGPQLIPIGPNSLKTVGSFHLYSDQRPNGDSRRTSEGSLLGQGHLLLIQLAEPVLSVICSNAGSAI